MTATFVVETGANVAGANSYVTVEDADQYVDNTSADAGWIGGSTADKQKSLRLATQYIDNFYHLRWRGRRRDSDQPLDWPRYDVVDTDGFYRDSATIPQEVKDAVVEMAVRSINGTDLMPDITSQTGGTILEERVKVDTLEREVKYQEGTTLSVTNFRVTTNLLKPIIHAVGLMERA